MFSGSWKESTMETIDIHIVDPNIDLNSLHIALGSLYQDEITVEPAEVITILAAANLFQVRVQVLGGIRFSDMEISLLYIPGVSLNKT